MNREHWVRALAADYPLGVPPFGQIGKLLKPAIETEPFSKVQIAWRHFWKAADEEIRQNPGQARYWTVAKFAATWRTWERPSQERGILMPYRSPYLTADEADRRAGIPIRPDPAA